MGLNDVTSLLLVVVLLVAAVVVVCPLHSEAAPCIVNDGGTFVVVQWL